MKEDWKRAEKLLRRGRISVPHARYFITCCTDGRRTGLDRKPVAKAIVAVLRELQSEHSIDLRCATIMPDHFHLLFSLGERLRLAQVIGKLKSSSSASLTAIGLSWQANYYDHRLRAGDAAESFARYIFLNPYRSRLIACEEVWQWWVLNRNYRPEFIALLGQPPLPPREWLETGDSLEAMIERDRLA